MRNLVLAGAVLAGGLLTADIASATVIGFDGLPLGTNPNPLVLPGATFTTASSGFNVIVDAFGSVGLCPSPVDGSAGDCSLNLTVDFDSPSSNLSFMFAGNNTDTPGADIGVVQLFAGATLLGTRDVVVVDGSALTYDLVTLSGFSGVTRLVISSTDLDGVVYDNFSFDLGKSAGVPEPGAWALMIAGFGLVGGALRRRARLGASAV